MNAKIINIRKLGEAATLAGADKGRGLFAKLILTVGAEPLFPSPLFLDFSGVEVATASYLRESVFEFRRAIRSRKSNYYPVIADANASVLEEVAVVAGAIGETVMTCCLSENGECSDTKLVGELDPKQLLTYKLVERLGETDAAELKRDRDDEIGQTAWNNRLTSLANMGLIMEISQGRTKRYKSLVGGC